MDLAYDFEGGIYQLVERDSIPVISLSNQDQYEERCDRELEPFAVIDKMRDTSLIGTKIQMGGRVFEIGKDIGLPQLEYTGFNSFEQARTDFSSKNSSESGLYSLIRFEKHIGPERINMRPSYPISDSSH